MAKTMILNNKNNFVLLTTLFAFIFSAMCGTIILRGPWYDEFFTYFITRADLNFQQAAPAWLGDNHPPLYYFLTWSTGWLGQEIAQRRFVNVMFLIAAVATLGLIGKCNPRVKAVIFYYAIAISGYTQTIEAASELRSYFLSLCAGSVAILALTVFARPFRQEHSTGDALFLTALLAVGFYIHFVTTIILGSIAVSFGVRLLLWKDWRGAMRLLAIGMVSAIPLLVTLLYQRQAIMNNTRSFWIPEGFMAARWAIDGVIKANIVASPLLTLSGVAGLLLLCLDDWREKRISAETSLVMTLCGGVALALAVLIIIHLHHPIVTSRYLICLHPAFAMIIATGIVVLARKLSGAQSIALNVALIIGAGVAIFNNARLVMTDASWNGTSSAIATIARRCPTTVVHADMSWNEPVMGMPPIQNRLVFPFAYGKVASSQGFKLELQGSRRLSTNCPTVFWTEHGVTYEPDAREVLTQLRAQGFAVRRGWLRHIGWGWIFVSEPDPQAN